MKKRYVLLMLTLLMVVLALSACSLGECKHEFTKWEVERQADCAGPGLQSRECEKCGYTETEKIEATLNHKEEIIPAVAPTCTETGLTEGKKCQVCGLVTVEQTEVAVIDHSYSENLEQAPACNADGVNRFTCTGCGDSYTEAVVMPSYTAVEIHDMTEASVGEVTTYDAKGNGLGLGSCFVYSSDGTVVTNYHVIEGAYSAQVAIDGKTYDVTQVLAYSTMYDLAVLKINATDLTAIPVCQEIHAAGETVYAFGSSQGLTATFSQGIITNADRDVDGVRCVQHDAAISSGNSGGPLINRFGEVIGINTWIRIDSQNLNFAVSVTELSKLDYSSPMMLSQVADLETAANNPYEIMKEYILNYGDFYSEDYEYSILMDPVESESGSQYISYYNYDLEYEEIELCLTIDWDMFLYIYMDSDGIYGWAYWDVYDDYMYGYTDLSDFVPDGMLPYDGYELNDSETPEALCSWASMLADLLCGWLDIDLEIMGLTAEDLGLPNF